MTSWYEGMVDGDPAKVKEAGDRVETIWDFDDEGKHAHIVTNDGVNADFYREADGSFVVDNSQDDPYGAGLEPPVGF